MAKIKPLSKPRNVWTIREAAKYLKCHRQNIHYLIHAQLIEAELVGDISWRGFYFVGKDSVEKYASQRGGK